MSNNVDNPLVSIITVVFNGINTINRTIESVVNQTYNNIEYIIIDGGSTDGTLSVINKYKQHIASLVSEPDKGIADAMNKGIALATGALIGLINADDWFELNAVEQAVSMSLKHPDTVIHGNMRIYSNASNFYIEKAPLNPNLNKGMELNHPTVFVPNKLYKKYGVFDTRYHIVFDWELMLRYKLLGVEFIKIDKILSNFSVGGISTTHSEELISEMHQVRKQHNVYQFIDKYYVINKLRSLVFGSNVIKISQKIRLIKYRLQNIKN